MENATKSLLELRRLLRIDYEAEREEFRQLTRRSGMARLSERGLAWWPVGIGRTYYNSLNQRVVEIFGPDDAAEDHRFESGRQLTFCTSSRGDDNLRFLFNATVSFVDGRRMVAVIPADANPESLSRDNATTGVVLSPDDTSYRIMCEALDRTMSAKGRLGELRDLVYSGQKAEFRDIPSTPLPYINRSQQEGVDMMLAARDVAVLHGPPGTGKTTTLVEAIYETLRREPQVLVCAQSNMAVDWICEKLSDRGLSVLRIGNPVRVNDRMLSSTYERRFEDHPEYPTLWKIRRELRQLHSGRRAARDHDRADRLRAKATEIEIRINRDILESVSVVASTLVGSANRLLEGHRFDTLFIDEAAQALEPASWVPARLARRIILAGDHCQLPPTVKSHEAARGGLDRSLMERIADNHPEAVRLLTRQYRMHEDIMRFSSEWFYGGMVEAAEEVRFRSILDFDTPIEWVDTDRMQQPERSERPDDLLYRETAAASGHGRLNEDEALLTLSVLADYIRRIGMERFQEERIDTGIITPYRAQARLLRGLLAHTPFFRPLRHLITVDTVDGFQGRERDVVVISLVRSNDGGDIGFLRDLRRMNVAMTRARMKLILIGSGSTFEGHRFYRRLRSYISSLRS